jgi:hypothetical protein
MKPYNLIQDTNYKLLRLHGVHDAAATNNSLKEKAHRSLCVKSLCQAIQHKCDLSVLKWYLQQRKDCEHTFVENFKLHGGPALYYAIERNSIEAVQILLEYGINPDEHKPCFSIPPLAFAIIHGRSAAVNTTEVVKQLLAYGADPNIIPSDMWAEFLKDPKAHGSWFGHRSSSWCNEEVRAVLAPAFHLTHRYSLSRADRISKNRKRKLQIATKNDMANLFKIPYFMIGQLPSANLIMNRVYSHIGNQNYKKKPLVLAFVGASGHGKTEMAKQLGDLLSAKHTVIDCAQINDRMDFLGASNGYHRSDQGSPLNNFLGDNSGKRAVVFLDEFDKTEKKVRNSLLVVMQDGTYVDRRYNYSVDSTNFIWVIASNLGTDTINEAYNKDIKELDDKAREKVDLSAIQAKLREVFFASWGEPFTGRIDLIVPFLPFSHAEQAVVLHKFMLDFQDHVRNNIDLREDVRRYIGRINLDIVEDGDFCSKMADRYYIASGGARSLLPVVDMVEDRLVRDYTDTDELVEESMNSDPLLKYIVQLLPTANYGYEVNVFKDSGDADGEDDDD